MGIISGFLCLICLILPLVKAVTHIFCLEKADGVLMKIHKYLCIAFAQRCPLLIVSVLSLLKTRSPAVPVTGLAAAVFIFIAFFFPHHEKRL